MYSHVALAIPGEIVIEVLSLVVSLFHSSRKLPKSNRWNITIVGLISFVTYMDATHYILTPPTQELLGR
jgi:hypothetical protein